MDWNRRRVIGAVVAVSPGAFTGRASAQALTCAAGLVVVRVEVRREIAYIEGEISIARGVGGTFKFKMPYYVNTSVIICEPPKPPDPKDPKAGWSSGGTGGNGGYAWFLADVGGLEGYFQGLSVRPRLPSFTRLSATNAKLTTVVGLTDGTSATLTSALRHNGSEFRVSDDPGVRSFSQTYGSRLASFEQRILDIEVEAFADGADTVGIDTFFQNQPLKSRNQLLHVSSGGSKPPGFIDPEGTANLDR